MEVSRKVPESLGVRPVGFVEHLSMVKEVFPYLMIGHLVGDYVLQSRYIAVNKLVSNGVLLIHVGLVGIAQFLFTFGLNFGIRQFAGVILITVIHFLIDLLKKFLGAKANGWKYYLFDQLLHLMSLAVFAGFFTNVDFLLSRIVVVLTCVGLFNAYFIGLLVHFIEGGVLSYKRDYAGYVLRMVAPVFLILGWWYFLTYLTVVGVVVLLYFNSKRNVLLLTITAVSTYVLMGVML